MRKVMKDQLIINQSFNEFKSCANMYYSGEILASMIGALMYKIINIIDEQNYLIESIHSDDDQQYKYIIAIGTDQDIATTHIGIFICGDHSDYSADDLSINSGVQRYITTHLHLVIKLDEDGEPKKISYKKEHSFRLSGDKIRHLGGTLAKFVLDNYFEITGYPIDIWDNPQDKSKVNLPILIKLAKLVDIYGNVDDCESLAKSIITQNKSARKK